MLPSTEFATRSLNDNDGINNGVVTSFLAVETIPIKPIVIQASRPQGKALRKAQDELAVSVIIPISIQADVDDVASANPVLQDQLMRLTLDDFKSCRITPDGLSSIIDAIMYINGTDRAASKLIWTRIYSEIRKNSTKISVEFHQFPGARQRETPVAAFHMLLCILALVPGPKGKAIREAQAELSARSTAGDHDLQAALLVRRAQMGSTGQALAMNGMASSSEAFQKRALEAECKVPVPKRRKMEYTTAQLMEAGANFFPGTAPLVYMAVESAWFKADHNFDAFIFAYGKMLAIQNSQMAFSAEEERKQALHEVEIKRKQGELKNSQALHDEETKHNRALHVAVLINETARGQHVRDAEMERARLDASNNKDIALQQIADRKAKADKCALNKGARKLAVPDVRRVLEAHFGDGMTARCGKQPCGNRVNAAKTWIVAKDNYKAGMPKLLDNAFVVCPTHAKTSEEPVRHLHGVSPMLVEAWLYRIGIRSTKSTCGICGVCPLRLWGDVELCHVVPAASGGTGDVDNIVLGAPACNRQQGGEDMGAFAHRISSSTATVRQLGSRLVPKPQLSAARTELMSVSVKKALRDAVERVTAQIKRTIDRSQQLRLKVLAK
jgi:hypothetical protein